MRLKLAKMDEPLVEPSEADAPPGAEAQPRLIEIGWVFAGKLDDADREACSQARELLLMELEATLSEFQWRIPFVRRDEMVREVEEEPIVLLDHAVVERDLRHWDFTLVLTSADLTSYEKPYLLAALSRSLDAAVISTARIDPAADRPASSEEERVATMAWRVRTLAFHLLGHLNGLTHTGGHTNVMFDLQTVGDLDAMRELEDTQIAALRRNLHEIGDLRLEEQPGATGSWPLWFSLRSAWINRREILDSFLQARPWQFPVRLNRLTIGALSTMFILLITAEAWDLGMSQSGLRVTLLSISAIALTTAYVLLRQRLFVRRKHRQLSEQTVTTNLSTVAIVLGGMTTTYALLFLLTFAVSRTLFGTHLVEVWAASLEGKIGAAEYLKLAALVSSLGIFIGALGASFEGQYYFRHVTFVDEET